jgi:hypothetical protein
MRTTIVIIKAITPCLILGAISLVCLAKGCKEIETAQANQSTPKCYYVLSLDGKEANLGIVEEGNTISEITGGAIYEGDCNGELNQFRVHQIGGSDE